MNTTFNDYHYNIIILMMDVNDVSSIYLVLVTGICQHSSVWLVANWVRLARISSCQFISEDKGIHR